ncbi:phosphoribosylaminoimidazolesuccinocarboxamide synthase [Gilvibacter sp.]|uniref:phosphoribosylaminoimidazolesuccinocarboxamide synthase n=1 Tax=Gilvibacter sp. TaxID=2729997 RepID=UPI003F4A7312
MHQEKRFKTKNGFCHILYDKLVLTQQGDISNPTPEPPRHKIILLIAVYFAGLLGFYYYAYDAYSQGKIFWAVITALVGSSFIWGIVNMRNVSYLSEIKRRTIKKVVFKKGIKGFSEARFDIFFEDQNGKIKKRWILLNGNPKDDSAEVEQAVKILKEEGLLR